MQWSRKARDGKPKTRGCSGAAVGLAGPALSRQKVNCNLKRRSRPAGRPGQLISRRGHRPRQTNFRPPHHTKNVDRRRTARKALDGRQGRTC